jgi:hypothetical protein
VAPTNLKVDVQINWRKIFQHEAHVKFAIIRAINRPDRMRRILAGYYDSFRRNLRNSITVSPVFDSTMPKRTQIELSREALRSGAEEIWDWLGDGQTQSEPLDTIIEHALLPAIIATLKDSGVSISFLSYQVYRGPR